MLIYDKFPNLENLILEKCKSINRILIPSDSERRYIAGLIFVNNFATANSETDTNAAIKTKLVRISRNFLVGNS